MIIFGKINCFGLNTLADSISSEKMSSWESEIEEKKYGSQTWKELNGKNQCSWSWGIV